MNFTCSVEIKKPINEVVALFDNPENLSEWQDGFIRMETISGTPGEVGSKSRMLYKMGKGTMELIETILVNDLPNELKGQYEHKHMDNTMSNRFTTLPNGDTLYEAEIHYTAFKGFIVKVMKTLFPGMFKKQVQKWLNQFRDFCEKNKTNYENPS